MNDDETVQPSDDEASEEVVNDDDASAAQDDVSQSADDEKPVPDAPSQPRPAVPAPAPAAAARGGRPVAPPPLPARPSSAPVPAAPRTADAWDGETVFEGAATMPPAPGAPVPGVTAASAPGQTGAATAAVRRPWKRWLVIAVATLAVVAMIAVGGVALITQPWRKVGFNATVHAAGPDMPKMCRALLGSDKAVSKAFGYTVTATDPGDKADTGVCMYRDDSGVDHEVGIGYAPQHQGDAASSQDGTSTSAGAADSGDAPENVVATSKDGRYVVSLQGDAPADAASGDRLRSLFQKAADRLTDDGEAWSSTLSKLDPGATVIADQSVCLGRACNDVASLEPHDSGKDSGQSDANQSNGGQSDQSSDSQSSTANGGNAQSKDSTSEDSNDGSAQSNGAGSNGGNAQTSGSQAGTNSGSAQSNQSGSSQNGDANTGNGGSQSDETDQSGESGGANAVPVAYAYDTSLALLDHPVAVKTKLSDGSTQYALPADGETFTLLDFRRAPANACAKGVCTWKGEASKEAALKVNGKADADAGRVLKGVVGSDKAAHGTFVVSGAGGAELGLDVKAGDKTYSATMRTDASGASASGAATSGDAASASGDAAHDADAPAVDAEKAKKAAVAGAGAHDDACRFGCAATGVVSFEHPVWGPSYLVALAMGAKADSPAHDDIDGYDYAYGFAVVGQSGQAMYGSNVFVTPQAGASGYYIKGSYNIVPALEKPDKAGNILLAAYVFGGGSADADELRAFHVGDDGALKALAVTWPWDRAHISSPTITAAGDADDDGLADAAMRMGDYRGTSAADAWFDDYRWAWDAKAGAYQATQAPMSEQTAVARAKRIASVMYSTSASVKTLAPRLSDGAEIFAWDACEVKKVADVKPFDVKWGSGGSLEAQHIDDPVGYSLEMDYYLPKFNGSGGGAPVDNVLTNVDKQTISFCQTAHSTGIGGLGGVPALSNSVSFGDASYDDKSHTVTLDMTVDWEYRSDSSKDRISMP